MNPKHLLLTMIFVATSLWSNTVSNLSGDLSVNQGALTYSLPLVVPPGTAGAKPDLVLQYNSNSGNGYFGQGWAISGQSSITRCGSNIAMDGKIRGVKGDSQDNICLDGQRLILANGSKWEANSDYRTKIDSYSKIVYDGTNFTLYSKSGEIKKYEPIGDSWLMTSLSDRFGNEIKNHYTKSDSENYISHITYSDNTIVFNYEDRLDKSSGYNLGKKRELTKRVKSIDIKSGATTLRTYSLTYKIQSSSIDKLILETIKECSESICLEPITLEYDYKNSSGVAESTIWLKDTDSSLKDWNIYPQDMNGDGLADLIQLYKGVNGHKIKVSINSGKNFKEPTVWFNDSSRALNNWGIQTVDINMDGLPDLVQTSVSDNGHLVKVSLNNGTGFERGNEWLNLKDSSLKNWSIFIQDIDGDNRPDVIQHYKSSAGHKFMFKKNNGSSFTGGSSKSTSKNINLEWNSYLQDINGDGLSDIILSYKGANGHIIQASINQGGWFSSFSEWHNDKSTYLKGWNLFIQDMNGDGLADLVQTYKGSDGHRFRVSLNTGTGFKNYTSWLIDTSSYLSAWNLFAQDMNGDGLADLVQTYKGSDGHRVRVSLSTGTGFKNYTSWLIDTSSYLSAWNLFAQDMNGDGLADIVQTYKGTNSNKVNVSLNNATELELKSITDSFENKISIEYGRLNDPDIYTKHNDASYPIMDLLSTSKIVSKTKIINANDTEVSTSYKYEGLKANLQGYGSLGFAKITSINHLNNSKNITEYIQDVPFIGFIKSSSDYIDEEIMLKKENEYSSTTGKIGLIKKTCFYRKGWSWRYYSCNKTLYSTRLHNLKSTSYIYDKGELLSTSTTENLNYDAYGNVRVVVTKQIDEVTGDEVVKTTKNNYSNDESKWILGRLVKSSVVSEASGDKFIGDSITKTSSFTYDEDSGILLSETIEPQNETYEEKIAVGFRWEYFNGHYIQKSVYEGSGTFVEDTSPFLKKLYEYDNFGNKIKETISGTNIEDSSSIWEYDSKGKFAIKATNSLGHSESKSYDANGNLISITGPNGLTTTYEYDNFGKKTKETRADGTTTTYSYEYSSEFGSHYKITAKSDGANATTTYYNRLGAVVGTTKIAFDGRTVIEDVIYDDYGNKIKQSIPYYEGENPTYITLQYDKYQRVVSQSTPMLDSETAIDTISYDKFTTITTDALGKEKIVTKNILGKVIKVEEAGVKTDYYYDVLGRLVKTVDDAGNEIKLEYDIFGNKIKQIDPDMGTYTYTYNVLGQLLTQVDNKSQTTSIKYDKLGRKVEENIAGVVSQWEYDTNFIGKLHKESKGDYEKLYTYDEYGRLVKTTTIIDGKELNQALVYDKYGKLIEKKLPNEFRLKYVYNDSNYLSAIKSPKEIIKDFDEEHFASLVEKSLDSAIVYYKKQLEYKSKARQLERKANYYKRIASRYERFKTSYLRYADRLERYAKKYEKYAKRYERYANYYKGRADYYIERSNRYRSWRTQKYYEKLARRYTYYSQRYAYLTEKYIERAQRYQDLATSYRDYVDSDDLWFNKSYNYYIDLANKAIDEAKEATQVAKNYATKSEQNYETNRHYQEVLDDSEYNYFYKVISQDALGRVTSYMSGNGLITTKKFDDTGLMQSITTGYKHEDSDIRDLKFEYDKGLNVTSREDNILGVSHTYTYDNLDRVISADITTKDNSLNLSYSYDTIGNITYKSDIGDYEYSTTNPHQVIRAGDRELEYDQNGNVLKNGNTTFEHTPFNKVSKILKDKKVINFYYDSNKFRYKKQDNNTTTYYLGKSYEHITHANGNTEDKYMIYAGGNLVSIYSNLFDSIGELITPATKYLHYDNLGSIDTITDNKGVVEARYAYQPFGKKLNLDKYGNETDTISSVTNRGFTGHEQIDDELIHMNARVYDSTLGRFMSADSMIPYMYQTQSFNRYSYVRNNPLKYVDPSGHWGFIKKIAKKIKKTVKKVVKKITKHVKDVANGFTKAVNDVGRFVRKNAKTIVTIAAVIATGGAMAGLVGTGFWGVVASGAASGFVGGVVGTKLHGGSWHDAFQNGAKGALVGAISGGVAAGVAEAAASAFNVSSKVAHSASFFTKGGDMALAGAKALGHAVSRAAIAAARGQGQQSAFISGFISSGFAAPKSWGFAGGTAATAMVSGTVSSATGGKFANGAMTGAFIHMYNGWGSVAGFGAKQGSKEVLNMDDSGKRIAISGIGGMVAGGVKGAIYGSAVPGFGTVAGGVSGAISGLGVGLSVGTGLEISGWGQAIEETTQTITGTVQGYFRHVTK
jgi:RHS repeat-associated protein